MKNQYKLPGKTCLMLGVVAQVFNPSTGKAKAG